jgi:hypothetical protein
MGRKKIELSDIRDMLVRKGYEITMDNCDRPHFPALRAEGFGLRIRVELLEERFPSTFKRTFPWTVVHKGRMRKDRKGDAYINLYKYILSWAPPIQWDLADSYRGFRFSNMVARQKHHKEKQNGNV